MKKIKKYSNKSAWFLCFILTFVLFKSLIIEENYEMWDLKVYLDARGEERDAALESTDSPMTSSDSDPEVALTTRMLFTP